MINAAAYTAVDAAETPAGRRDAWATNVDGVAALVAAAREHRFGLVHVSSDYVFDGTREVHAEDEPFSPLGVYGQTKAAGDALVATLPRHYILRTSWVIGDGHNFVRTMAALADRGVEPGVVDDQYGRLTFTDEIARAIRHLLEVDAPYGTYNLSGEGPATQLGRHRPDASSWRAGARPRPSGRSAPTRTARARRWPRGPGTACWIWSKITATGFRPAPVDQSLVERIWRVLELSRPGADAERGDDQQAAGDHDAPEPGAGTGQVDHLAQRGGSERPARTPVRSRSSRAPR